MKTARINLLLLLLTLLSAASCRSHRDEPRPHPTLDIRALELIVGETATITVKDADEVTARAESEHIAVEVDGLRVHVTALQQGTSSVTVRADGVMLRCAVSVAPAPDTDPSDPTQPDEPTDNDAILADSELRYESQALTMRYDAPGTIFMRTRDGRRHTIRSLASGDCVTVDLGSHTTSVPGVIDGVSLTVNDQAVPLSSAEIVSFKEGRLWLKMRTERWNHTVWLIVER